MARTARDTHDTHDTLLYAHTPVGGRCRINALKDEAEGCVDHLCHLIMEILRPGIRWNNGVGKIIEATHTMVEVAGPTHAFIASCSRPRGATKNRSKPSYVCRAVRVVCARVCYACVAPAHIFLRAHMCQ
jgi:hypothetical protein